MIIKPYSIKECRQAIKNSKYDLPIILGKNAEGELISKDFKEHASLAIFGSTSSGKSNFIHSLIYTLISKNDSKELNLICIDPKMSNQYSIFKNSPYFPKGVITDFEQAVETVLWCSGEIQDRYKAHRRAPATFLIIDEYSDLILGNKDIEGILKNIIIRGPFVGVYLVISTSIPSQRIFTEELRTHIPGRIAFRLANQFDSMYALGLQGAEKLNGSGEMLFHNTNYEDHLYEYLQAPEVTLMDIESLTTGG